MLGDIIAADRTFHKAAELFSSTNSPEQQRKAQAIMRRHQGLLLFARNDFAGQFDLNSPCGVCLVACEAFAKVINGSLQT